MEDELAGDIGRGVEVKVSISDERLDTVVEIKIGANMSKAEVQELRLVRVIDVR